MITKEEANEQIENLKGIDLLWSQTGMIDPADMRWLMAHTKKYWLLAYISDDSWARNRTEILAKDLEIEDLKRQLEEALGN